MPAASIHTNGPGVMNSRAAVTLLEMLGEIASRELFAGGALEQFGRRKARTLRPDFCAPPFVDRVEFSLRQIVVDGRMLALQRSPLLCSHHGAERIGRKVAEGAARPMHILHWPVGE